MFFYFTFIFALENISIQVKKSIQTDVIVAFYLTAYGGSYNTSSGGYTEQLYSSQQYPEYGTDMGRGSGRHLPYCRCVQNSLPIVD